MIKINKKLLDMVTAQAKELERLRMNYNFHQSATSKTQRLLNALEPGTVIPIHRHPDTAETYILLRGRIRVFFYENKQPTKEMVLDPDAGYYGIHIEAGEWHSLEVLESNTVIFEVKDGPYLPLTKEHILCLSECPI